MLFANVIKLNTAQENAMQGNAAVPEKEEKEQEEDNQRS